MLCLVVYFIYILNYPGSESAGIRQDQAKSTENPNTDNLSLDHATRKIKLAQGGDGVNVESDESRKKEASTEARSFKPPYVELWKGLYQRHWPQLLDCYNISLLGRYVTILPPVHLGINIDTDVFSSDSSQEGVDLLAGNQGFPSVDGTVKLDQALGNGEETAAADEETRDPEYYHNALACVILGVVVMIILFFVCKFLNDLQLKPRSGCGRKRTSCGHDGLVESVPISLRGHTQNIEHLKVTMSSIISVCLSGQICVWDIATGYRLRVINRKSPIQLEVASKKRSSRLKTSEQGLGTEMDSGYTTQQNIDRVASPRPLTHSEHTSPQASNIDDNESGATSGGLLSPKTGGENEVSNCELRGSSRSTGYDFSKYANGAGIPPWSPRSPKGSFTSSWSSVDGEDPGWLSSSEESGDEQADVQTNSYHDNQLTGASVWCFDCKDDLLVTGCSDGTIEIWSVLSGVQLYVSRESSIGITKLSFLSSRPQIVVARLDGSLEFFNLGVPLRRSMNSPLQESSPIKRSSPRVTRKINPHSNNDPGTIGKEDPTQLCINLPHPFTLPGSPQCRVSHKLRAHHQPISVLGVMEGRVITGSHDRTLKVFRTDEYICVYTLHGHADSITALTVDKTNNRQVVSGAANGGVRVWDVISGECLQHLRGHVKSVTAVTCTVEHLLSVSLESVLCIWDRSRGECLHRLKQFPDLCSNVVMLSRTLFITGGQGHISVWDALTGRRVKTVLLGDGDTTVFVRCVNVCDNKTVVCDYGKEVKIVTFPAVMDKAE